MTWFKRIALFMLLNMLVISTISFLLYIFNVQPFLTSHGIDYNALAIFCLLWGMGGAFISLALSKIMAKWMMSIQVIDAETRDPALRALVDMVHRLAKRAGLSSMPEVGIYESQEVNAFATGPTQRHSLVAVSTGLLRRMESNEVEGVLAHEVSHIANGDMVTMTLLQGVVNAFVMFLARVIAFVVTRALSRDKENERPSPFFYQITVFVFEIAFMMLGAMVIATYSRWREFHADAGGAALAGREKMISALVALKRTVEIQDVAAEQPSVQAFKISNPQGLMRFFATHPPLDVRIARLKGL